MSEENEGYPHSAISSWSGFVYQGKVALYHCLKMILEGDVDFELQLDSTDDFAIYKEGVLLSAHQVKAKVGKYRSSYIEALDKSAEIELDRIKGTRRYFHLSVEISDMNDYLASNGEIVIFYSYSDKKYCGLGEIELLTKSIIEKICESRSIVVSDLILSTNYCCLSEKISSKAVEIHKKIQVDGETERKAAYQNRIHGQNILEEILNTNPYNDTEYYSIDLKNRLNFYLEDKLDRSLFGMTDAVYERARRLFEHIRETEASELKALCQLMKPSERFSRIQSVDIRRYSGLIHTITVEPKLYKLPHYVDKCQEFYIPTALDIYEEEEYSECSSDIINEIKSNDDLLKLLFEYNNLIAFRATESYTFDTRITDIVDLKDQKAKEHIDSNITKTLCISILSKEEAEARLK